MRSTKPKRITSIRCQLQGALPGCHAQRMKICIRLAAFCALGVAVACAAQDGGYWRAASTNAKAITGDIAISENKVVINFAGFLIARVRSLQPAEAAAAFDADVNAPGNGALYHLNVPAGRRFLHRNTLCGTEDTQWMATYVSGHTLQAAFFSGQTPPVLTIDALANTMERCGTFTYAR